MKTKIVLCAVIAAMVSACQPPVTFTEPLPPDGENETTLPEKLFGTYKSAAGDELIEVSDKAVFRKGNFEFSISKAEADSSPQYVLNGNVLYDKSNDININVTLYHDTLRGNWKYTDTLFVLTGENVVREFKGHYFLNTKSFDGYEVMMLTPDRKGFSLKNISDRGMLESLQKVTDVVIITDSNNNVTAYKAKPTKKELKKFIRASNADSDGQSFYKIQ